MDPPYFKPPSLQRLQELAGSDGVELELSDYWQDSLFPSAFAVLKEGLQAHWRVKPWRENAERFFCDRLTELSHWQRMADEEPRQWLEIVDTWKLVERWTWCAKHAVWHLDDQGRLKDSALQFSQDAPASVVDQVDEARSCIELLAPKRRHHQVHVPVVLTEDGDQRAVLATLLVEAIPSVRGRLLNHPLDEAMIRDGDGPQECFEAGLRTAWERSLPLIMAELGHDQPSGAVWRLLTRRQTPTHCSAELEDEGAILKEHAYSNVVIGWSASGPAVRCFQHLLAGSKPERGVFVFAEVARDPRFEGELVLPGALTVKVGPIRGLAHADLAQDVRIIVPPGYDELMEELIPGDTPRITVEVLAEPTISALLAHKLSTRRALQEGTKTWVQQHPFTMIGCIGLLLLAALGVYQLEESRLGGKDFDHQLLLQTIQNRIREKGQAEARGDLDMARRMESEFESELKAKGVLSLKTLLQYYLEGETPQVTSLLTDLRLMDLDADARRFWSSDASRNEARLAFALVAKSYLRMEQPEKAAHYFRRSHALGDHSTRTLMELAAAEYLSGQIGAARTVADELLHEWWPSGSNTNKLSVRGSFVEASILRAAIDLQQGTPELAESILQRASGETEASIKQLNERLRSHPEAGQKGAVANDDGNVVNAPVAVNPYLFVPIPTQYTVERTNADGTRQSEIKNIVQLELFGLDFSAEPFSFSSSNLTEIVSLEPALRPRIHAFDVYPAPEDCCRSLQIGDLPPTTSYQGSKSNVLIRPLINSSDGLSDRNEIAVWLLWKAQILALQSEVYRQSGAGLRALECSKDAVQILSNLVSFPSYVLNYTKLEDAVELKLQCSLELGDLVEACSSLNEAMGLAVAADRTLDRQSTVTNHFESKQFVAHDLWANRLNSKRVLMLERMAEARGRLSIYALDMQYGFPSFKGGSAALSNLALKTKVVIEDSFPPVKSPASSSGRAVQLKTSSTLKWVFYSWDHLSRRLISGQTSDDVNSDSPAREDNERERKNMPLDPPNTLRPHLDFLLMMARGQRVKGNYVAAQTILTHAFELISQAGSPVELAGEQMAVSVDAAMVASAQGNKSVAWTNLLCAEQLFAHHTSRLNLISPRQRRDRVRIELLKAFIATDFDRIWIAARSVHRALACDGLWSLLFGPGEFVQGELAAIGLRCSDAQMQNQKEQAELGQRQLTAVDLLIWREVHLAQAIFVLGLVVVAAVSVRFAHHRKQHLVAQEDKPTSNPKGSMVPNSRPL